MRHLILCLLLMVGLAVPATLPLQASAMDAEGIVVEINKGRTIKLPTSASVVAIADPEIADVEVVMPGLLSIRGRGVGQTSIIALDGLGEEILNDTVTVTHNLTSLNRVIRKSMPGSDVTFDSVDGALVVTGHVSSPLEAENIRRMAEPFLSGEQTLVNMLRVDGSDQVLLKVKVAEVSRTELKRFGINLASALTNSGNFAFGLVTGRDIGSGLVNDIVRNVDDNSVAVNYSNPSLDVNSVIDALAEDNLIKVLAEPNLTTSSGRKASFLAGGEIPIPVPGQDGQVTIEWREYGVRLEFTPQVLSRSKISMTVAPEVSELTQIGAIELQGFNIPALSTRRAETTVELGSGQSFAIAGLLQHDTSNDVQKFPGLGDLPVLGGLFRSTEFRNDQTELVILITPYIVKAAPAGTLTTPDEGMQAPNDAERHLLGRMYTPTEPAAEKEAPATPESKVSPPAKKEPAAVTTPQATEPQATEPVQQRTRSLSPKAQRRGVPQSQSTPRRLSSATPASAAPIMRVESTPVPAARIEAVPAIAEHENASATPQIAPAPVLKPAKKVASAPKVSREAQSKSTVVDTPSSVPATTTAQEEPSLRGPIGFMLR